LRRVVVERAYPVTSMIALGMILPLSYFFVRRTIGFSEPIAFLANLRTEHDLFAVTPSVKGETLSSA
jgi:hypothetical protein